MRLQVLGPVEVRSDDDRLLASGGGKQQALLFVLALSTGRRRAADDLIEALWGEDPPASAAANLRTYVLRLRKALGQRVVSDRGGYRLEVGTGELDLRTFESLREEGRDAVQRGDLADAVDAWSRALAAGSAADAALAATSDDAPISRPNARAAAFLAACVRVIRFPFRSRTVFVTRIDARGGAYTARYTTLYATAYMASRRAGVRAGR